MDILNKIFLQAHDLWFKIPDKVRFILIGGFNSIVSLTIFVSIIQFFAVFFVQDTANLYKLLQISVEKFIPIIKYISFDTFIRQIALALAWFFSSFVSFTTQRLLVFRAKGHSTVLKQYLKCLSTWMIGYLINAIILEVFASIFEKTDIISNVLATDIAQVFSLIISSIVTYILFKYFAFKKKEQTA